MCEGLICVEPTAVISTGLGLVLGLIFGVPILILAGWKAKEIVQKLKAGYRLAWLMSESKIAADAKAKVEAEAEIDKEPSPCPTCGSAEYDGNGHVNGHGNGSLMVRVILPTVLIAAGVAFAVSLMVR